MRGSVLALSLGAALVTGLAGGAAAQEAGICPAPISICSSYHVLSPGAEFPIPPMCPPGSTCTCVPSCPFCRDCAVQVCVPDAARRCRTACDCEPGLGCFDGQCIAGFAPVFCCESPECPAGQLCQHADGTRGQCAPACVEELWRCDLTLGPIDPCGEGRVCACTASCPACEDCGPSVCAPEGSPTPYRCDDSGGCARPGDRCVCVSSCRGCDDCALSVCVPACDGPRCEERVAEVTRRIESVVRRASLCRSHDECVQVSTSTECQGTCGAWVSERYAGRVMRQIARLNEAICSDFLEDGCSFATPACLFERGVCVDRRCRGVPVLPSPVPPDGDLGSLDTPISELLERMGRE